MLKNADTKAHDHSVHNKGKDLLGTTIGKTFYDSWDGERQEKITDKQHTTHTGSRAQRVVLVAVLRTTNFSLLYNKNNLETKNNDRIRIGCVYQWM